MCCYVLCISCGFYCCAFFFFKQKTAYEMRISDWSSDVCFSDLDGHRPVRRAGCATRIGIACNYAPPGDCCHAGWFGRRACRQLGHTRREPDIFRRTTLGRSEEHTSELQSLMRISYAVFCLKQKTNLLDTNYS